MLPVGDDIARTRTPALAPALALVAAVTGVVMLARGAGWAALACLVAAWWLAAYGTSIEATLGRVQLALTVICGAVGGALVAAGTAGDPRLAAAAAVGAATALVAAHLAARRGARVLTLQLLPPFTGFLAVPAWIWAAVWVLVVAGLAALGAFRVT